MTMDFYDAQFDPYRMEYETTPPKREPPTIEEFLLARVQELERRSEWLPRDTAGPVLAQCAQIRSVLDWHKKWPVLIQKPMEIKHDFKDPYAAHISYAVTQQMEFVTQEEFRKRFDSYPPTAPLLRQMAEVYKDHPDYNPEWRR